MNCYLRKKNTLPNNTQPSKHEETLSQEKKMNLGNVQRIMNREKTTLPLLKNIEWKTPKIETNKINHILPYIPTNNITELNKLFYEGAKLVCEKIGIPSKNTKNQSKPGWELRLKMKIKNLRKQARLIKKRGAEKSGKKSQAMMESMGSGSRNSPLFTED